MTQLTLWDWVCSCGGTKDPYPVWRKNWTTCRNFWMCYKCFTIYEPSGIIANSRVDIKRNKVR